MGKRGEVDLALGRTRWRDVMNTAMNIRSSVKCGPFEIVGRSFHPFGLSRHTSAVPKGLYV
jgi:hypothetical protein